MDELTEVFRFDRTTELHRTRTRSIDAVLTGTERPDHPSAAEEAMGYALAHHFLEGAERAARDRDSDLLRWYRANLAAPPGHWFSTTNLGRRVVASPSPEDLRQSPIADTPTTCSDPTHPRRPRRWRNCSPPPRTSRSRAGSPSWSPTMRRSCAC